MIPHHAMALMMSQRAIEAARSDSVKALARDILDQPDVPAAHDLALDGTEPVAVG